LDLIALRTDFRDAARFMAWDAADKHDIGAAIKAASSDPEATALWAAWLADLAREWRAGVARVRSAEAAIKADAERQRRKAA
jgi:hypothetical protein